MHFSYYKNSIMYNTYTMWRDWGEHKFMIDPWTVNSESLLMREQMYGPMFLFVVAATTSDISTDCKHIYVSISDVLVGQFDVTYRSKIVSLLWSLL